MSPYFGLVLVVLVLGYAVWGRLKLKGAMAANADKNIAPLMARLGLSIVEGDGNLNLLYFAAEQPIGDFSRKIRATGTPYDHPTQFTLTESKETNEYLVARKITTRFGCYLEVAMQVATPTFEVTLRAPNQYLVPRPQFEERTDLQEAATGSPALDRALIVRCADPTVARRIAPALESLTTQLYVHLAGDGNRVWIGFTRMALPYFANAPEEALLALASVACALEGRALPAQLPAAIQGQAAMTA